MSQRYQVRLTDGTKVAVDRAGLQAWLTDEGAMVQAPGLQQWRPLRVLVTALERSAAKSAPVTSPTPVAVATPPPDVAAADPSPLGEPRGLVTLADEVASADEPRDVPVRISDLPVIPLKPIDDDEPASARRADVYEEPAYASASVDEGDSFDDRYRGDPRDERLFRAFSLVGNSLSPLLRKLDRVLRRLPPPEKLLRRLPSQDQATTWLRAAADRVKTVVESSRRLGTAALRSAAGGVSALAARRRAETGRILPDLTPEQPSVEKNAVPRAVAAALPAAPVKVVDPVEAPLPIQRIAVLPLAELPVDEEESETLYDDSRGFAGWAWVKNVVLLSGLAASAVFIFDTRETWLPQAEFAARALFTEIDAQTRSREVREQREWAMRQAREQMPHLAPATLQLVLSVEAVHGALGAPDLFRFTSDLLDRGLDALPRDEARELQELRAELLSMLSPADRERVRAYDQARGYRATLPFEDREALAAYARGARALSHVSRARLQTLSGEAIATGLRASASSHEGRL